MKGIKKWWGDLVDQIGYVYSILSGFPALPANFSFLVEVLETIDKSEGNSQEVYPFLSRNLDKLNRGFFILIWAFIVPFLFKDSEPEVAEIFANKLLKQTTPGAVESLANKLVVFGDLLLDFPEGNRIEQVEIASEAYDAALQFYKRFNLSENCKRLEIKQNTASNRLSALLQAKQLLNIPPFIKSSEFTVTKTNEADFKLLEKVLLEILLVYFEFISEEYAANNNQDLKSLLKEKNFAFRWSESLEKRQQEVVYPILESNLDKLNDDFAELLKKWGLKVLPTIETLDAQVIASELAQLAMLLLKFPQGNQGINQEIAIACSEIALELIRSDTYLQDLIGLHGNLSLLYVNRIRGDRVENLKLSISHGKEVINNKKGTSSESNKAIALKGLALAYWELAREATRYSDGNYQVPAEVLKQAIDYCHQLEEVITPEVSLSEWATLQMNLGNIYAARLRLHNLSADSDKIANDSEENFRLAVGSYQKALKVFTLKNYPQAWALTQINLGAIYLDRINGDVLENGEKAVDFFKKALQVYSRRKFPYDWAVTRCSLGGAYQNLNQVSKAIRCFQLALKILKPTVHPDDCLRAGKALGDTAFKIGNQQLAIKGYDKAIAAAEQSRDWVISRQRKQEILETSLYVYEQMIQASINAEQPDKAWETLERSKSRNLVELLAAAEVDPKKGATESQKQQLRHLRRSIHATRQALEEEKGWDTWQQISRSIGQTDDAQSSTDESLTSQKIEQQGQLLQDSQEQLNRLLDEIKQGDPEFTLTQRVEPSKLSDIRSLIDSETAILEWHIGIDSFQAFVITHDNLKINLEIVPFTKQDLEKLNNWANEYISDYEDTKRWKFCLGKRLSELAQILQLSKIVPLILSKGCKQLILIPHRFLHLLPLHALPLSLSQESDKYLLDYFPQGIRYAPSCQLLQRLQNRQHPVDDSHFFFAVEPPLQNLACNHIEVETIQKLFDHVMILKDNKDIKTAFNLQDNQEHLHSSYVHFACHGKFDFEHPLRSALIFTELFSNQTPQTQETKIESQEDSGNHYLTSSNEEQGNTEEKLTLQDIFATLDLSKCRLVTLSACETGFTDLNHLTDEYVGLPSGFLYAGSTNVVSSLWSVEEWSTAILMIEFYQNLQSNPDVSIAVHLRKAQLWLRTATIDELLKWTEDSKLLSLENKLFIKGELEQKK